MTPVFDEDQRKAPNDQSTKLTHECMNKDTKSIAGRSIILKGGVIFITPPPLRVFCTSLDVGAVESLMMA